MLYLVLLLLGALLVLASFSIEHPGVRTLVLLAGEAVFGGVVFVGAYGVLKRVIAVVRSTTDEEES